MLYFLNCNFFAGTIVVLTFMTYNLYYIDRIIDLRIHVSPLNQKINKGVAENLILSGGHSL